MQQSKDTLFDIAIFFVLVMICVALNAIANALDELVTLIGGWQI